jgi:hypothetical protein
MRPSKAWSGEEAYWHYVQSRDLEHYLALWSDDFDVTRLPIEKVNLVVSASSEKSLTNRHFSRLTLGGYSILIPDRFVRMGTDSSARSSPT